MLASKVCRMMSADLSSTTSLNFFLFIPILAMDLFVFPNSKYEAFMRLLTYLKEKKFSLIVTTTLAIGSQALASTQPGFDLADKYTDGAHVLNYQKGKLRAQNDLQVGSIASSRVGDLTRRRSSLNLWGYGIGPYYAHHLGSSAMMYSVAATNHREVSEYGEVRIRMGANVAEDGEVHTTSLSMGGAYMPFVGDVTPLLGAELGLAYAAGKKIDTTTGFAGALLFGLRFFRTSNTHLELAGRYETFFNKNKGEKTPATFGVQLSVLII